jgi:hypothetical protein
MEPTFSLIGWSVAYVYEKQNRHPCVLKLIKFNRYRAKKKLTLPQYLVARIWNNLPKIFKTFYYQKVIKTVVIGSQ